MRQISVGLFFLSSSILFSCTNSISSGNLSVSNAKFNYEHKGTIVRAEYIVTVKKDCDEFLLRKFFYEYGIVEIRFVKENAYLIKFANDPGLEALSKEAKKTNTVERVQPNYVYKTNPADQ